MQVPDTAVLGGEVHPAPVAGPGQAGRVSGPCPGASTRTLEPSAFMTWRLRLDVGVVGPVVARKGDVPPVRRRRGIPLGTSHFGELADVAALHVQAVDVRLPPATVRVGHPVGLEYDGSTVGHPAGGPMVPGAVGQADGRAARGVHHEQVPVTAREPTLTIPAEMDPVLDDRRRRPTGSLRGPGEVDAPGRVRGALHHGLEQDPRAIRGPLDVGRALLQPRDLGGGALRVHPPDEHLRSPRLARRQEGDPRPVRSPAGR
jgi:hypothetical protein